MKNSFFVGRKQELENLEMLYKRNKANLVVIKGPRRIGKSRLVKEFSINKSNSRFLRFEGLAPIEGSTAQTQRDNFSKQLSDFFNGPIPSFVDWYDAFRFLSTQIKDGDILLFDEISWMGDKDPTFIPKFKVWWDNQTSCILLFLCGSVSTWVEDNILKSTALFGRINHIIELEPLTILESIEFLKKLGVRFSAYETFMILSIFGGIPWYLEQLDPIGSRFNIGSKY